LGRKFHLHPFKKQVKNGDFSKIAFAIPYITRDYKVEVKLKSGVFVIL